MTDNERLTRRTFLRKTATTSGLAAASLLGCSKEDDSSGLEEGEPKIRTRRALGSTGFLASDIGFGSAHLNSDAVLKYALDRGVNYIDTAHGYPGSEETIAKAIKGRDRKKLFIVTKMPSLVERKGKRRLPFRKCLEQSLEKLEVDYVDGLLLHLTPLKIMERKTTRDFLEKVLGEGKVRFAGASFHEDIPGHVDEALKDDLFQIMLFCFNYLTEEHNVEAIKRGADHGRAMVAMKSLMGGYQFKLPGYETVEWHEKAPRRNRYPSPDFCQSALKFVLSRDYISNVIISMENMEQVDTYLPASGKKFCRLDDERLKKYKGEFGSTFCRIGCNTCYSDCPRAVPVNDILRYEVYSQNYGWREMARASYQALDASRNGAGCGVCSEPCAGACPHGIRIKERMTAAHRLLSPSVDRDNRLLT